MWRGVDDAKLASPSVVAPHARACGERVAVAQEQRQRQGGDGEPVAARHARPLVVHLQSDRALLTTHRVAIDAVV